MSNNLDSSNIWWCISIITVSDLNPGQTGTIKEVGGDFAIRRRMMEMGVLPGSTLTLMRRAPLGDPLECRVRGYNLTLRLSEADLIKIELDGSEK